MTPYIASSSVAPSNTVLAAVRNLLANPIAGFCASYNAKAEANGFPTIALDFSDSSMGVFLGDYDLATILDTITIDQPSSLYTIMTIGVAGATDGSPAESQYNSSFWGIVGINFTAYIIAVEQDYPGPIFEYTANMVTDTFFDVFKGQNQAYLPSGIYLTRQRHASRTPPAAIGNNWAQKLNHQFNFQVSQ